MSHAPPPRERLTALALRILEDATADAHRGPVKRTMGHRLALAWLAHERIGLEWHYAAFWQLMTEPLPHFNADYQRTYRTTRMNGMLDYWWREVGWERKRSDVRSDATNSA